MWDCVAVNTLQTVDRALRLLVLAQREPVVTLARAAGELGVGTSVAHRLLATLEANGFMRRSLDGPGYRLGPAMTSARPAHADTDFTHLIQDDLLELQAATGETVEFAVLEGQAVRYIYGIASQHQMRIEARAGTILPAHIAACGRALLATLTTDQLRRIYPNEPLPHATGTTTPTRTALEAELENVRQRGYARNIEETQPGIAALAQTLPTPQGYPPIAITISGPQARLRFTREDPRTPSETALTRALRQATQKMQAKLTSKLQH
ncbi:transcriptional regulator [Streptomyces viridosporus ATCC 14672]|uniref:IclR family transcriptional regulator n=2 Tax=Streptomyces viridosporus TaxID=67581 RepID=A0ABX6AFX3_STRVD|nr:transcriptional regulator [Streptomyces viridosporus ATCC 14672]QEU85929.1 IclR family transcriptional regulator [Streptomyces viridosporus T7A]